MPREGTLGETERLTAGFCSALRPSKLPKPANKRNEGEGGKGWELTGSRGAQCQCREESEFHLVKSDGRRKRLNSAGLVLMKCLSIPNDS